MTFPAGLEGFVAPVAPAPAAALSSEEARGLVAERDAWLTVIVAVRLTSDTRRWTASSLSRLALCSRSTADVSGSSGKSIWFV